MQKRVGVVFGGKQSLKSLSAHLSLHQTTDEELLCRYSVNLLSLKRSLLSLSGVWDEQEVRH